MIRLIILVAIFIAVYPYIGDGYEHFTNDFDVEQFYDFVEETADVIKEMYARIFDTKPWYQKIFS